jgi:hypothetical protein
MRQLFVITPEYPADEGKFADVIAVVGKTTLVMVVDLAAETTDNEDNDSVDVKSQAFVGDTTVLDLTEDATDCVSLFTVKAEIATASLAINDVATVELLVSLSHVC